MARLAVATAIASPSHPWTLPDGLKELVATDEDFIAELLHTFADDTSVRLRALRAALAHKDRARLRDEFHSIKGAASQLGVQPLAHTCQCGEMFAQDAPFPVLEDLIGRVRAQLDETVGAMGPYME